jgi:tRNA modification GTPase
VAVSAVSGVGLDVLRRRVAEGVFGASAGAADLELAVAHERHRQALALAEREVEGAIGQIGRTGDAVLAAHHLRAAAQALEELVGAIDVEQVLDRVFGSFCIGK